MKKLLFACFVFVMVMCSFNLSEVIYADNVADNSISIPAIMYHSVHESRNNAYVVSPSVMENDLIYLAENGYTPIFISQLIDFVDGKQTLPQKPIIITLDDGYYNNYTTVYPLLKKYNMKCNVSIVGSYVDKDEPKKHKFYSYMTWEQVEELAKTDLFEFHNHSYNMHSLSYRRNGVKKNTNESIEDYSQIFIEDAKHCQDEIEKASNQKVQCYCYPFGIYDDLSNELLLKQGYRVVMTCSEIVNNISKNQDLIKINRFNRPCWLSTYDFFRKIEKKA